MRQIFILEKEELALLRTEEGLKIILGDQTITLVGNVKKQVEASTTNGRRPYRRRTNKRESVGDRVIDYLREHGPNRAVEIADGLGVPRSGVASALARFRGISVRRAGKQHNAAWRIK